MYIGVCDDEKIWRDAICNIIHRYFEKKKIASEIFTFSAGEELLDNRKGLDLIFLDVEMKALDGLETAKRIRIFDQDVKIVFLTNHQEIMKKAFRVNAFRFLDKSFKEEDINMCLDDFLKEKQNEKLLEIELNGIPMQIKQKDIMYISAVRNGTMIWCTKESFISKRFLKEYETLMDPDLFFRCHRDTLVNVSYIDQIRDNISLFGGYQIKASKRNKTELKNLYTKYLVENAK